MKVINNKGFLIVCSAYLVGQLLAFPVQDCMYCLNSDSNAGFMFSYSFCKKTGTCVADEWNKINAWCDEGWIDGYKLDLVDDCNALAADPIVYESFNIFDGYQSSKTIPLSPGFYQDIEINAKSYVARFLINSTSNIGVEYMGFKFDQWVQVDEGTSLKFRIYNAKASP